LQAWRIEQAATAEVHEAQPIGDQGAVKTEENDDLPF